MEHNDIGGGTGAARRSRMRPPTPLQRAQYAAIIERMPAHQWRLLTDYLAFSGERLAEAFAHADTDIDPGTGACEVRRYWRRRGNRWELVDSPAPRRIYLPEALVARLELGGTGEELFRIGGASGPGLLTRYVRRVWTPAVAAVSDEMLGGARPGVDVLRVTCAQWMAEAGVPWPLIAAHLGFPDNGKFLRAHPEVLATAVGEQ
ncbi:hypothetical protein [Nocardia iowensis]|uniref:Tyr recombinase domain-containing protein n=1 Tax=Nocardia iowensis TaxID=204891 RepID=A0ABX8RQP4_NOCIO|nr:hypothetical protein [Nocardia iowensis]QXN91959.1 hypothetical protein KV110_01840 [Nocardia iowensis]